MGGACRMRSWFHVAQKCGHRQLFRQGGRFLYCCHRALSLIQFILFTPTNAHVKPLFYSCRGDNLQ